MLKIELMQSVQYITDCSGTRKAVLLDFDVWQKIIQILPDLLWTETDEAISPSMSDESELQCKIAQIREAPNDPLFMADLQETMSDFSHVDSEWWERDA